LHNKILLLKLTTVKGWKQLDRGKDFGAKGAALCKFEANR